MFDIIERKMIVPNLHMLVVHAPEIVEEIEPGQFVIVHAGEGAERIPLTPADWNHEDGNMTIVFMEVGTSTGKLAISNRETGYRRWSVRWANLWRSKLWNGDLYRRMLWYGIYLSSSQGIEGKRKQGRHDHGGRSRNLLYWEDSSAVTVTG